MADFVRYFNRDTGLNDVVVHELICSIVRWWKWNKRL